LDAEWGIERLDVAAYLDRLGYRADLVPSRATVAALHRAHVAAMPFENLDVVLGRTIRLDMDSLQQKLVRRRRGGYGHEHHLLFAAPLDPLGYRVTRLAARVRRGGSPGPRSHKLFQVHLDVTSRLADVGFGGALLEPILLEDGTAARQGAWTYCPELDDDRTWTPRSLTPQG